MHTCDAEHRPSPSLHGTTQCTEVWANRGQLAAHRLPLHDLASFCFLPKYCNFAGHLTQDILAKLKETVQMSAVAAFIGHLSNNTGTGKKKTPLGP